MHRILIIDRGDLGESVAPMLERENLSTTLEADPRSALEIYLLLYYLSVCALFCIRVSTFLLSPDNKTVCSS